MFLDVEDASVEDRDPVVDREDLLTVGLDRRLDLGNAIDQLRVAGLTSIENIESMCVHIDPSVRLVDSGVRLIDSSAGLIDASIQCIGVLLDRSAGVDRTVFGRGERLPCELFGGVEAIRQAFEVVIVSIDAACQIMERLRCGVDLIADALGNMVSVKSAPFGLMDGIGLGRDVVRQFGDRGGVLRCDAIMFLEQLRSRIEDGRVAL